ncbi:MAG: hypothetical protein HY706_20105, partial [Candidatus Hydrogenedentes bacterium]|nr:hypothetical protein [Candidatus Hydrogenedentota bacterium]
MRRRFIALLFLTTPFGLLGSPASGSVASEACDINWDAAVDAVDVQVVINAALGLPVEGNANVNRDSGVDALDIQMVINSALGLDVPGLDVDLSGATVVVRSGELAPAEAMAATVLVEEIQKRTGLNWGRQTTWPNSGPRIVITSGYTDPGWGHPLPGQTAQVLAGLRPDGYWIHVDTAEPATTVWIIGADARGALYGAGKILRSSHWFPGSVRFPKVMDLVSSPAYPLRGHQLGYRNTANSYDAWDESQYEQYIRELIIFGANAIENIPFDASASPHFQVQPGEMARRLSAVCARYDIAYWVWTPAQFDLNNVTLRDQALQDHEAFYQDCARLDGVFVPGGDPGDNHPSLVMPFLEDLAALLKTYHPAAGVWVSNQGFEPDENNYFFLYLQEQQPDWLAGVVYGPWTKMTLAEMRNRTPNKYPVRRYPDITHSVRCQFPVDQWDRAFAHTLGREPSNPRPMAMAQIHNVDAQYAVGFVAYSDGCHDDVNKAVWCAQGWYPSTDPRDTVREYARFFFGSETGMRAVRGIMRLEENWQGPLAQNTSVDETLSWWQQLETSAPELAQDWRWQLALLRAYYDAYVRARLIYETGLEEDVNSLLANSEAAGAENTMTEALNVLALADTSPVRTDLRTRI